MAGIERHHRLCAAFRLIEEEFEKVGLLDAFGWKVETNHKTGESTITCPPSLVLPAEPQGSDLTGRRAICSGCSAETDSTPALPSFRHQPEQGKDSFRCCVGVA